MRGLSSTIGVYFPPYATWTFYRHEKRIHGEVDADLKYIENLRPFTLQHL